MRVNGVGAIVLRGRSSILGERRATAQARLAVGLAAGLVAVALGGVPVARAATIHVTRGAVDAVINDNCSIREAITAANTDAPVDDCAAGSGADTITASGSFVLTTPDNDANGLPVISSTITITKATISRASGAPAFRIFAVASTGNLTLKRVTVSGGLAPDCPNHPGRACGGGIANEGTLTVKRSRIVNNAATASASTAEGAGIANRGTATVANSVVGGNSATNSSSVFSAAVGGGIVNRGTLDVRNSRINDNTISCSGSGTPGCFALGGGIYNVATLTVSSSRIVNNAASCSGGGCVAVGGGIANDDTATVKSTRVSDNTASCSGSGCTAIGGGIGFFGTVNLTNSRVTGNTASCSTSGCLARGGGLDNNFDGTLNVSRSKVRGNSVRAPNGTARGGGLYNGSGTSTLTDSAVIGNTASGAIADGGGIYVESGSVILNDTRVSDNTPNNCRPLGSVPGCTN
jgi:hypothetical protein